MASPGNYDFLNDYLSKITSGSDDPDDKVIDDNDDFYSSAEDDDEGYRLANDWLHEHGDPDTTDSDYENGNGNDDSPVDDTDMDQEGEGDSDSDDNSNIYGNGNTDSVYDISGGSDIEAGGGGEEIPTLKGDIADRESQGKYSAYNSKGGGSGAVGKYQFRWDKWQDSIKSVTGVKSKEAFLKSPEAQEKYYAWYEKNYLLPTAQKLRPYNKKGLSDEQLAKLVHFRGEKGAKDYLTGKASDKPESYNMSTSKYIATKQHGGGSGGGGHMGGGGGGGSVGVAMSASAQHTGLNNSSYDHMIFPMHGENEFRGLDDGTPVYLEDEYHKKKKLKGKHHKTKMRGTVIEHRSK